MLTNAQLSTIFKLQIALDEKIAQVRAIENLNSETTTARFLALIVEIGELANEFRCFKYWSSKPPSEKHVLLEEFSDGLHFIISIAASLGLKSEHCNSYQSLNFANLNLAFIALVEQTTKLFHEPTGTNLNHWLNIYYSIAKTAGFSSNDIFSAYLAKNKINHQRQEQNY